MKHFKYYILFLPLVLFIPGCKKFVEIDPPKNQLVTPSVFASNETAIAATTAIYSTINKNGEMPYLIPLFTGLSGDELTNFSTSINYQDMYANGLKAVDSPSNRLWTVIYNIIYLANSAYEGCNNGTNLSPDVKKQLMAEALFVRALCHFYLVNLFGDVPLVTSTDYRVNSRLSRTAAAQVYDQIVTDLKTAQEDLNVNYVSNNTTSTSTDRFRPNKAVATALLARVYLYLKMYAEAEQQASMLLQDKSKYTLVPLSSAFLKGSKEAIWQLMVPTPNSDINTYEGNSFILQTKPTTGSANSSTLSPQLLASFDLTDQRKTAWINKYTDKTVTPNVDYPFPFKYKVFSSGTVTEHSVILRLGEQFLIRAESRAQLGNLSGAIQDLDSIRNRAGLPLLKDVNPGISKENLLSTIFKERQNELFTEWGHRWMDLKRSQRIDAVMNVVAPAKGTIWKSSKQLWPIPQREIQNNNNIGQNPEYN